MSAASVSPEEGALPRAYLRPCLLVLLAEGPSHGYELLEGVRRLGFGGADAGGLYRTLRAMEREVLVRSWWEASPAGPARRTYELNTDGEVALRRAVAELQEARRLLGAIVERWAALRRRGPS
ncbi:helix-turn-helix transcriptional regulator [soil metagenome]|nr:helix-turn-helix transcriptional regulator [Acidimicrobiia bacterium]